MRIRRKFLCTPSLALLAASAFCLLDSATSLAETSTAVINAEIARIKTESTTFDFGKVTQGTKVEHSFPISNTGKAPLKIERLNTSCGCTAAVVETAVLEPGQSTQVKVSFDTAGFSGLKVKTARLYTNDPKTPTVVFTLQGQVEAEIKLSLEALNFGQVNKGSTPSLTLDVIPRDPKIKISSVSSRSAQLDIKREELPTQGARFKVSLKAGAPIGPLRDRLSIKTSSSEEPLVNVGVFAKILGDLRLNPDTLSFGLLEAPLTKSPELTSSLEYLENSKSRPDSQPPLRILSVDSDNPLVSAEVVQVPETPSKLGIKVSLASGLSGAFRAKIKVVTTHPDSEQNELILPIYGIVAPPN